MRARRVKHLLQILFSVLGRPRADGSVCPRVRNKHGDGDGLISQEEAETEPQSPVQENLFKITGPAHINVICSLWSRDGGGQRGTKAQKGGGKEEGRGE